MRFFLDVVVCQLQMFCYFLYACWHVCICWVQHTKPVWIVAALVRCRGKLFFFHSNNGKSLRCSRAVLCCIWNFVFFSCILFVWFFFTRQHTSINVFNRHKYTNSHTHSCIYTDAHMPITRFFASIPLIPFNCSFKYRQCAAVVVVVSGFGKRLHK